MEPALDFSGGVLITPCIIDFDEASYAWRANKRQVRGGSFVYTCAYVHTKGKHCRRPVEASQVPRWRYYTHPNLKQQKPGPQPHRFCVRHKIRGPAKELLGEIC